MKPTRWLAVLALVAASACATAPRTARTNSNSNVITASELAAGTEANLYDYVAARRPRWLQPRQSTGVVVYLNQSRTGGPEVLRSLSRDAVSGLRFYDVTEAQQRFPNMETSAVIQVTMK